MNEQIIVPTEAAGHLVNVLKNRLSVVEANNKALYTRVESQVLMISRLEKQRDELLDVIGKMIGDLHERAYHELMTDPKHYAALVLKQLTEKAKGE